MPVWCGVVWCGVAWCGVAWCGVVWCNVMCGVTSAAEAVPAFGAAPAAAHAAASALLTAHLSPAVALEELSA